MEAHLDQRVAAPVSEAELKKEQEETFSSSDDMMDRVVENAIVRGIFGHNDASRRDFV